MKKIFRTLVIFLLFLTFVNTSIFLALRFFDSLPFILDVLILYFITPVALALGLSWLSAKIFQLKDNFMEQSVFQVLIGVSLFMWLVIIIGSYTGVKEFVELQVNKEHLEANVNDITQDQLDKAGFVTLKNTAMQLDKMGTYQKSRRHKSGDTYTTLIYHYYTIPVQSTNQIQFWLVDYIYYGKGRLKKTSSKLLEDPLTVGTVVQDSREKKKYKVAVDIACKKYGITPSENIVYLKYAGTYDEMLSSYKMYSIIYFVIVNILLVFLPTFLLIRHENKSFVQ